MPNLSAYTIASIVDSQKLWSSFDTFWQTKTAPTTFDLTHYQAMAAQLLEANIIERCEHFTRAQSIETLEPYLTMPWYPIVVMRALLSTSTYVTFGSGYSYSLAPEILYGAGGISVWKTSTPPHIHEITYVTDSVTKSSVAIDRTQLVYDPLTGVMTFSVDPFSIIPARTLASGGEYIVLWARNPKFDFGVPFNQTGWVLKYSGQSSYVDSLQKLWSTTLRGSNLCDYKAGIALASHQPVATAAEVVREVLDDGYMKHVVTDSKVYSTANTNGIVVVGGTQLVEGQPLTDVVKFFDYQGLMLATPADVPGVVIKVPLSTGVVAELTFRNINTAWTYDAGRPSPWRFIIGGSDADVEQYWIDSEAYAIANGIDLATLFGLPASVNPMQLIVNQLLKNNIYVASVDLTRIEEAPDGFADRATLSRPNGALLVLQQAVGEFDDTLDLATSTVETVTYGMYTTAPTELIAPSATDLTYTDLAPFIVIS